MSDRQLEVALGRFAALADLMLRDPGAWLGGGPVPGASGSADGDAGRRPAPGPEGLGHRALGGLGAAGGVARRLVAGRRHPGSAGWAEVPVDERARWWVSRTQTIAAPIAATPRIIGALADRLPLQGTLGAAAAGLTVCAVAREHGIDDPQDWVPLLARVLFDRDLPRPDTVPDAGAATRTADARAADPAVPAPAPVRIRGPLRRAAHALWRLGLLLWGLPGLFENRPRGFVLWRALGKLPLVGLPAGLLDERGAVRSAADETRRILQARPGDA